MRIKLGLFPFASPFIRHFKSINVGFFNGFLLILKRKIYYWYDSVVDFL